MRDDIQALQDDQERLAEDIDQQQANIEEAEGEYEQSVAEADEQYEENEADAQRQYEAAEAAAAESTSAADDSKGDQSSGSTDNNPTGNDPSFDGLSKAFEQAFQNALDGTVAPDAIDQALQEAFDKALQEAPETSADDAYRGLAASLLDALTAQGSDAGATSEPPEGDGKSTFWDDIVKGISETLDDWDRWFGWRDKRDALWQAGQDIWNRLSDAAVATGKTIGDILSALGGLVGLGAGSYSDVPDPKNAGEGKEFTRRQKDEIMELNKERNDGVLKSDLSGEELVAPEQHQKGVTPPSNEAHVDHVVPRSRGGTNSSDNAQVLSREENLRKGNK